MIPVMIFTVLKTSWWWWEDWNNTMVLRVQIKSSYDFLLFKYDYCIITWITIHDSLAWIPVSRAASVCRDDFQPVITWGEPARLMADAMNHGRPERAWFWRDEGLMSQAGPANAITWKNLSSVSRDPGTAIPGSRLTGRWMAFNKLAEIPAVANIDAVPGAPKD